MPYTANNTFFVVTDSKNTDGEVEQECRRDTAHTSPQKRHRDADDDESPRKKLVRCSANFDLVLVVF